MHNILERFKELNKTKEQQFMLSKISTIRGYTDNTLLNKACSVQIHNESIARYLLEGTELYHLCFHSQTGQSLVYGKLMLPGVDPLNDVITFICYDVIAQQATKLEQTVASSYFFPESTIMNKKGTYLYAPPDAWDNIIASEDLFIVDGTWDSVTLNTCGFPTVALLMSEITPAARQILNLFKRLYLVMDNDSAGGLLYQQMIRQFKTVYRVVVPCDIGKDVDAYGAYMGLKDLQSQIQFKQNTLLKRGKLC